MSQKSTQNQWGSVVALAAVWGLSEVVLGLGLQSCAKLASGAIMTGAAFLFIAASWGLTKHFLGPVLLILVVSLLKMFDALLLSLPLRHGAVANPIFAFWMEGAAFLALIFILREGNKQKWLSRAVGGGISALIASNLFPLVKYVTGNPACVYPGTDYPLSLYFAPLAVGISLATLPLGLWAAEKITAWETKAAASSRRGRFWTYLSPATVALCLLLMILIRLG